MRDPLNGAPVAVDPEVQRARNKADANKWEALPYEPISRFQAGDWQAGQEQRQAAAAAKSAYTAQSQYINPATGTAYPGQGPYLEREQARALAAQKRLDAANAKVADWQSRAARPVRDYPTIAAAMLANPNLTEADVKRVVNFSEVWTLADRITGMQQREAILTLNGLPPAKRAVVMDIMQERADKEKAEADAAQAKATADLADKTTWGPGRLATQGVGEALGLGVVNAVSTGYEDIQHILRTLSYGDQQRAATGRRDVSMAGRAAQLFSDPFAYWDDTEEGDYNPTTIDEAKAKYGEMPVEIVLEIKRMEREGDPHPISTLAARIWDDPAKARVLKLLTQKQNGAVMGMSPEEAAAADQDAADQATILEMADKIGSAELSDLGAMVTTTNPLTGLPMSADSEWRGSMAQQGLSAATNVVSTFVFDPVILGSVARTAFLTAKYGLEKIAIDAGEGAASAVLNKPRTFAYLQQLTKDLATYQDMIAAGEDASKFAAAMNKRYARYFPQDTLQDLARAGVRTPEDFIRHVEDTNAALAIERGQAAVAAAPNNAYLQMLWNNATTQVERDRITSMAQKWGADLGTITRDIQDRSMFGRMMRQQEGRRGPMLLPRQNAVSEARRAIASAAARTGSDTRSRRAVRALYEDINNPHMSVGAMLASDPVEIAKFEEFGRIGRAWDRTTRLLSTTPGKSAIYTKDARDAGVFYKFARIFLGKPHAQYLAERWRVGDEAERIKMWVGLVQTAAERRGWRQLEDRGRVINLGKNGRTINGQIKVSPQELRDTLVFGTDSRSRFAPDSLNITVDGVVKPLDSHVDDEVNAWIASQTQTAPASGPTHPVYRVDPADPGINWDKPQGLYMSQVDDAVKSPHRQYIMEDAGGEDKIVEFSGQVRQTDVFDVTPSKIDPDGLRGSRRSGAPAEIDTDAGVGYVTGHMADGEEWLAVARNGNGSKMSPEFEAKLKQFDPSVNWAQYEDNYERLMAVGGIQARRDGHKAIRMVDEDYLKYREAFPSYEDMTEIVVLDRSAIVDSSAQAAGPTPQQIAAYRQQILNQYLFDPDKAENVVKSNPFLFNGTHLAGHLWQTSDYLAVPNLGDLQLLTNRSQFLNNVLGLTPNSWANTFVNYWSIATLAGFRYGTRNAIEDWTMYALTGGHIMDAIAGRAISTGQREARGKNIGWFARKIRRASGEEAAPGQTYPFWQDYILPQLNKQERADALAAMNEGDVDKWVEVVVHGVVRTKLGKTLSADEERWLADLVRADAKFREVDEVADAARLATMAEIDSGSVIDKGNKGTGVMGGERVHEQRAYVSMPMSGTDPKRFLNWHQSMQGILQRDGVIGRIAVKHLDDTETAIRLVAEAIEQDTKYGYKARLAAINLHGVSPEEFARRYVQDVLNTFSNKDGTLNHLVWRKFVRGNGANRRVAWADLQPDGTWHPRVTVAWLQKTAKKRSAEVPDHILGLDRSNSMLVPTKVDEKIWNAMSEAVARVSREPIYYANYLRARKQLIGYEEQLAKVVGEKAASTASNRIAMDRAVMVTMSYTDNPSNQTMLAYRMRNFARYYRATEDFYRRMYRAAKFQPMAFYKGWLALNVLDETGFIYTDSYGDRYFMYPGDSITNGVVGQAMAVLGAAPGQMIAGMPTVFGGKVKMATPSFDPTASMPMLSGALAALSVKLVTARFPQFKDAEKWLIGEYGADANIWQSVLPANVTRVMALATQDERDSLYASSAMNAAKVLAAAGYAPDYGDQKGKAQFAEDLRGVANQIVILKTALGLFVPSSPQGYSNDVTAFARGITGADTPMADPSAYDQANAWISKNLFDAGKTGVDGLSKVYRDLVNEELENGSPDPFGSALVKGVAIYGPSFSVYAERQSDQADGDMGLAPVVYDNKIKVFHRDNPELVHDYPAASMFLAPVKDPVHDRYSQEARKFLMDKGYIRPGSADPNDADSYISQVLESEASYWLMVTKDAADADLAAQTTDEGRKAADERRSMAYDSFDAQFPGYRDLAGNATGKFMGDLDRFLNSPKGSVRSMISDFYAGKYGDTVPNSVKYIAEAISTYDYFNAQRDQITGNTNAEKETKRAVKAQQVESLLSIAADDPNADQFIRRVLFPTIQVSSDGEIK